jgi:hypothetical protein
VRNHGKRNVVNRTDLVEGFARTQQGADGDDQNIDQIVIFSAIDARVWHVRNMRDQTRFCQFAFMVGSMFRMLVHPPHLYI